MGFHDTEIQGPTNHATRLQLREGVLVFVGVLFDVLQRLFCRHGCYVHEASMDFSRRPLNLLDVALAMAFSTTADSTISPDASR